ncbi:MAG: J domain-containing protein [Thermoleophilia bacterium]
MTDLDDHYATLDVDPDAGPDEVRAAWRFLITAFHPDRFRDPEQRERAQEVTKRANGAWQVLGDPARRRRYDLQRRRPVVPPPEAGPPLRRLPCPSCATRCRVTDPGGRTVDLVCPACGDSFPAMIGARCVGRPRLERRWLGMRHQAVFADARGERSSVEFRRLPAELALAEGELMSVVFSPRRGRPVYAIVHDGTLDIGWRVG